MPVLVFVFVAIAVTAIFRIPYPADILVTLIVSVVIAIGIDVALDHARRS